GATDVVLQIAVQLGLEARVRLGRLIGRLQFVDQRHQGLGHETAAIGAEAAVSVGPGVDIGEKCVHERQSFAGRRRNQDRDTALRKAWIRSGSLTPGALSTPEETSTIGAPEIRTASVRFSGDSPPARNQFAGSARLRIRVQSNDAPTPPGKSAPFGGLASNSR